MPRAIAPEVTITTCSPERFSAATWAQIESSTSARSSPSSAATIEDPSLTTRVTASKVAEIGAALGWGALAASSPVIDALLNFARRSPASALAPARSPTSCSTARSTAAPTARAAPGWRSAPSSTAAPSSSCSASTSPAAASSASPFVLRLWLWLGVAAVCTVATVVGYLAAGALLVMLIDSMIREAREDAGRPAGLVTVLGFALTAALSNLS